jgi:hypothetical protein
MQLTIFFIHAASFYGRGTQIPQILKDYTEIIPIKSVKSLKIQTT